MITYILIAFPFSIAQQVDPHPSGCIFCRSTLRVKRHFVLLLRCVNVARLHQLAYPTTCLSHSFSSLGEFDSTKFNMSLSLNLQPYFLSFDSTTFDILLSLNCPTLPFSCWESRTVRCATYYCHSTAQHYPFLAGRVE